MSTVKTMKDVIVELNNIRNSEISKLTLENLKVLSNKIVNSLQTTNVLSMIQSRKSLSELSKLTNLFDNSTEVLNDILTVQKDALKKVNENLMFSKFTDVLKSIDSNMKDIANQASPEISIFYRVLSKSVTSSMKLSSLAMKTFSKKEDTNSSKTSNTSKPTSTNSSKTSNTSKPTSTEFDSLLSKVEDIYSLLKSDATKITDSEALQARRKDYLNTQHNSPSTPNSPTPLSRREDTTLPLLGGSGLFKGIETMLARMAPLVFSVIAGLGSILAPLLPAIGIIAGIASVAYAGYKIVDNVLTDLDNAKDILGKQSIDFSDKVAVVTGSLFGTIGSLIDTVTGVFGYQTKFEKDWKEGVAQSVAGFFNSVEGLVNNVMNMNSDEWLSLGKNAISKVWTLLTDSVKNYFKGILSVLGIRGEQVDAVFSGVESAMNVATNIMKQTGDNIKSGLSSVFNTLGGWKDSVGSTLSSGYNYASNAISSLGGTDTGNIVTFDNSPAGSVASLLQKGESGKRSYNAYNRGWTSAAGSNKANLDISNMTIGEIMAHQRLKEGDPNKLFAVGKYQIVTNTMKEAVASMGLDTNQKFTPELQEKIFTEFLAGKKRKNIENFVKGGNVSVQAAGLSVAQEWASVGASAKGGRGVYDKVGVNHASISAGQMESALIAARQKYKELISQGIDPSKAYGMALGAYAGTSESSTIPMTTSNNYSPANLQHTSVLPEYMKSSKSTDVVNAMMQNKGTRITSAATSNIINNISPISVNSTESKESLCSSGIRDPKGIGRGFPSPTAYSQDLGSRQSCL